MLNLQFQLEIGLLILSLLALISLIRGSRTTQTLSLIQLFLLAYLLILWNMISGHLADLDQLLASPSSFPVLLASLVFAGIGLIVYLRKRPLG